jgi:hypothetical protein
METVRETPAVIYLIHKKTRTLEMRKIVNISVW